MNFEQNNNGDLVAIFTEKEADIFRKWIEEQLKKEKEESIESNIEWAKLFLKTAKELYPDKEFECWVEEDSKHFHFEVKGQDRFWGTVLTSEVILKVRQHLNKQEQKVQKRYYIS